MINIQEEIDNALVTESSSCGRMRHVYEDPEITFADIRDILT